MSNPSEDPKVTHNRAVVGSARNRRDVASWLDIVPADTSGDAPPTTNEEVPAFEAENETYALPSFSYVRPALEY